MDSWKKVFIICCILGPILFTVHCCNNSNDAVVQKIFTKYSRNMFISQVSHIFYEHVNVKKTPDDK